MKEHNSALKFAKEDVFFQHLRIAVSDYFSNSNRHRKANSFWYLKAWILIGTYISLYTSMLIYGETTMILYACYAMMGVVAIFLGLNVGHDAVHGTISKYNHINRRYAIVFDLLGGNSYLWKLRHIYAHHPYPNVMGYDSDIKQSKLVRIFPGDQFYKFHRFQHIYTPVLLIISYTLNWFFVRDFQDMRVRRFGKKRIKKHPMGTLLKMVLHKMFFLIFVLGIPMLLHASIWQVFFGFLLMNIFSGLVISIALVSTHVGADHEFPVPNESGNFDHSWAAHQIATTSDFCTKNNGINFLFGGFNHHVIHHLFPEINHVHYTKITPILKKVALEFRVNYRSEENLIRVFKSHIQLLKREGYEHGLLNQEI